jgi:uncharacterized phage-associated protein
MITQFRPEKAVQAAGVLLRAHSGREMDYMRLLKLLYISDRESLRLTGRPIIGNRPIAMNNGPLHSGVYDLIKGTHPLEQLWSAHFEKIGYSVRLLSDPGVLYLSEKEISILNEVSDRYRNMDTWELVEHTHSFEEWKKNHVANTSTPIPIGDILDGVGIAADDKAAILNDLQELSESERILPHHPVSV